MDSNQFNFNAYLNYLQNSQFSNNPNVQNPNTLNSQNIPNFSNFPNVPTVPINPNIPSSQIPMFPFPNFINPGMVNMPTQFGMPNQYGSNVQLPHQSNMFQEGSSRPIGGSSSEQEPQTPTGQYPILKFRHFQPKRCLKISQSMKEKMR